MLHLPERREFIAHLAKATTLSVLSPGFQPVTTVSAAEVHPSSKDRAIRIEGCQALENTLEIAQGVYLKNRVKDQLSFTNSTGYRMKLNSSERVSICIAPDLTFGLLGSRYLHDEVYLQTFLGHLDALPRNMRRNGRFFINEDLLAGAGRSMSQVMYPIWIWELFLATGDQEILKRHHQPLLRCLSYIESRTNAQGIVNQVDHDDWQISEGADWVDWCPERMEGSTCVYHTWYARALAHCIRVFRALGDEPNRKMVQARYHRQRSVLDAQFWSGNSYYDNLNFNGQKVDNFWCDSQIWPIAFGFASQQQAAAIFGRIDAEPDVFEGMPLRWCAPISQEKQEEQEDRYSDRLKVHLRPYSWFGRLGAGDVLARCATGQDTHAYQLLDRYAQAIVRLETFPECMDMQGEARHGTGGANDYLEHAGGFLLSFGRGLMGLDDTAEGTLVWRPRLPKQATDVSVSYWHRGHRWQFGYADGVYSIDPGLAHGTVRLDLPDYKKSIAVAGKRIALRPKPNK